MITKIGIVSGEILNFLEGTEHPVTLKAIIKGVGETKDIVLMSIGWLAREGYLQVEEVDGEYYVSKVIGLYGNFVDV